MVEVEEEDVEVFDYGLNQQLWNAFGARGMLLWNTGLGGIGQSEGAGGSNHY